MATALQESFLSMKVEKMVKNRSVYGAVLCVENGDSTVAWVGSAGNLQAHDRYFIASVTKMYITAIMIMLRAEKKLSFTDRVCDYFPEELISGIHVP